MCSLLRSRHYAKLRGGMPFASLEFFPDLMQLESWTGAESPDLCGPRLDWNRIVTRKLQFLEIPPAIYKEISNLSSGRERVP